jgi:hypothetical protein
MDKVKPYLFYIVCGVVLVVMLVLMVVFGPSHAEAPNATVEATKTAADKAYKDKLTKSTPPLGLEKRAEKTLQRKGQQIPENPRKPEDPTHVSEILDNYVIHASWNGYFQNVVNAYRQQLAGIKTDLLTRSEPLGEAVSPASDPGQWYQAYLGTSVRLLAQALESGVMVEPAKNARPNPGFGAGGFNQPAPTPVATTPPDEGWTRADLEESAQLRSVIGLYTSGGSFPPAGEHPQLTARLRSIERVVEALVRTEAEPLPNPNLDPPQGLDLAVVQPVTPPKPRIVSLTWGDSRPSAALRGAQLHRFDLKLRGTPTVLLAALARLDSITTPIVVRLGANWTQPGGSTFGGGAGNRGGTATPEMEVSAGFVIVDFRGLKGVDLTAGDAGPGPGGAPGMPGGMPDGNVPPNPYGPGGPGGFEGGYP